MNEELNALVGKVLNIPNEQIADYYESDGTTLKADAIERFAQLDAERIRNIKESHKTELTTKYDDGYSKGKAETLSKFEKQIKETYGVDADLKGIDLIKEIVSKNANVEIDEEKLKLHPRFIELERKLENDYMPKAEYDKVKAEYDEFKNTIEKTKVHSTIKDDALKVFRSLKPVLSKDATRALNQENDFVNKLLAYEYEIQEGGAHIIKNNGKRLETANGYAVQFADFIKSEASKYFDFEVQGGKGNAGNEGGNDFTITLPQSEKEYQIALANESDPKKAVALMNAWTEKNK